MLFKNLGSTNQKISAVGQGLGIGGYFSESGGYADLEDLIGKGLDAGMTFLDTAPVYGNGLSEEIVGKAIAGRRKDVFLATKVSPEDLSYERVLTSVENSLKRLKVEQIDLLQIHWPNPKIPLEETVKAMLELVDAGKVKWLGTCNMGLKELKKMHSLVPKGLLASLQSEYNLFERGMEDEIFPFCAKEKITFIAYSPLYRGRIASGERALNCLKEVAANHQKTIAQVALRWQMHQDPVVVIPNTTRLARLHENAGSADFNLSAQEIQQISEACSPDVFEIPVSKIRVASEPNHAAYSTLSEAKANVLNFCPSPMELADQIKGGEVLKPVWLKKSAESSDEFDLIGGRIRYWAWVIAYDGEKPIRARID